MWRHVVELAGEFGVDVGMVLQVAAVGVFCDVGDLILEVGCVADSVFVIAGLPDFSCELLVHGVGVAAFDALDATLDCLL